MDDSMPIEPNVEIVEPTWSLQPFEAKEFITSLGKVLGGLKLSSKTHDNFFEELPKRLRVTCKHYKEPGAEHACAEAIRMLHVRSKRRKPRDLTYVDRELIGTLRRVLGLASNSAAAFDRIMKPKFTLDAAKSLFEENEDMRDALAGQAVENMKKDMGWLFV